MKVPVSLRGLLFVLLSCIAGGQAYASCSLGNADDCTYPLFGDNVAKAGESTTMTVGSNESGCGDTVKIWKSGGCGTDSVSDDTGGCGYVDASISITMSTSSAQGCRIDFGADGSCYGCDPGKESTFYILYEQRTVWNAVSTPSYVGSSYGVSATAYTRGGTDSGSALTADANTVASGASVSYTSQTTGVCTVTGSIVTNVAAGTCTVRATAAAVTNNLASGYTDYSWTVSPKLNQSISVTSSAPSSANIGGTFNVAATASSGLSVEISVSGVCSIQSGGTGSATIEVSGAGTCSVYYDQAGNSAYNAASRVTENVTVSKYNQTISWGAQASQVYSSGGTFSLDPLATASSGFIVSYTTATPSVCTLTGIENDVVVIQSAGTCTINADQAGNANYNAASTVSQTISIAKADQSITVTTPAPANVQAGASFSVAASSSAGLSVAITVSGNCTISSGGSDTAIIDATGEGNCSVYYNQTGNANFNAASQVSSATSVTLLLQSITVSTPAPANAYVGDVFTVVASANSGLGVVITVEGGCAINSGGANSAAIQLTSGTTPCTIRYNQAGNAGYEPADEKTNTTEAIRINQSITVTQAAPASAVQGANFSVSATTSSGLGVSISASGGCSGAGTNSASISMNSATSSCTVLYTQAGNDDYYPADDVSSVTRDGTAPVINPVQAVPAQTNSRPKYIFNSTEAGTIVFGGSCTSTTNAASVGDNTIVFDELAVGAYSDCTVAVKDPAGNVSNILSVGSFAVVPGVVAYVKPVAAGAGDCGSWADACADIQAAIDIPAVDQVWVAKGVYRPSSTIALKAGVKIYGGFAGIETTLSQRAGGNLTIISGDTAADDVVDANNVVMFRADIVGTNLGRLFSAEDLTLEDDLAVTLSGLVLNAAGDSVAGGGLYASNSKVILENSRLIALSGTIGGAVSVSGGAELQVTSVSFVGNEASSSGGALYISNDGANIVSVSRSLFDSNVGGANGGAITQLAGGLSVVNTTFFANSLASSVGEGGAVSLGALQYPNNASFKYTTFVNNVAGTLSQSNGRGGAISIDGGSGVTALVSLSDSLIVENFASVGTNIAGMDNIIDDGYNIVGYNGISGLVAGSGDTSYELAGTSVTAPVVYIDELVDTQLAINSGSTANLMLAADSYAKDRIPSLHADCAAEGSVGIDQRGKTRPEADGEGCDVGAVEYDAVNYCDDPNRDEGAFFIGFYPSTGTSCVQGIKALFSGGYIQTYHFVLLFMVTGWRCRRKIMLLFKMNS